ncbi:MAG: TcpQ domain-containing protein [Alphaproteobacteria bacterium]|nr:TcpQ domain-containing protein [Alphaproteobacteria bacterium]
MAATVLAAAWLSTAGHAGFLYVPQAETPAAAVGAVGPEAAEAAHERSRSRATERSGTPVAGFWQVGPGETLRDVLGRWGGRAGIEVLFLTDRHYRLHEGRRLNGSFGEASQALFAALSHLPHPPVGEMRAGGGTLAVLHRVSPRRTGDGQ